MTFLTNVKNKISTLNSRASSTLAAGATFQGSSEDVSLYGRVGVSITSSNATDGVLYMEVSHDGVTWGGPPRILADTRFSQPHMWNIVERYFRIRYVNGTTEANDLSIQVQYSVNADIVLGHQLDEVPLSEHESILTKAVIWGVQPDGVYNHIPQNGVAIRTTSALGISGVFLSEWVDTRGYNSIELFISSDVTSVLDGIEFEFTDDLGVGTVRETLRYTYNASTVTNGSLIIRISPVLAGLRVRYTNGAVGQASFLLELLLKTNGDLGIYNKGGSLSVSDFNTEVALGNVQHYQISTKFGLLESASIGSSRTVWAFADNSLSTRLDRKVFPTAATAVYIVSESAADTAKQVTVRYQDSNNVAQQAEVTLNGQTPVLVNASVLDCDTAYISGNDQTLVGHVYVMRGNAVTAGVPNTPSDVLAFINSAHGRTQQATLRVPANTTMVVNNVLIAVTRSNGSSGSAQVNMRVKPFGKSWYVTRPYLLTTSTNIDKSEQMVFGAGDMIEFFMTSVSDANTSCNVFFEYLLIRDNT